MPQPLTLLLPRKLLSSNKLRSCVRNRAVGAEVQGAPQILTDQLGCDAFGPEPI